MSPPYRPPPRRRPIGVTKDDEPFYYLNPGDVIPRDAAYVIIGGTVKVIPPRIFDGYEKKNLKRVDIQEGVEEIGEGAFSGCPNLMRVDCPSSLRAIGNGAFNGCGWLSDVVLMEGLQRIGESAFARCPDLKRITVPSSVVEIGDRAFEWCKSLLEVTLQEGLRWIRGAAFCGCKLLKQINIPSSVVDIGEYAFSCCDNLETVTLTGGMVMLWRCAFSHCPLESIAISSTAIVVHDGEDGEDGDGRVQEVNGGIQWNFRKNESAWLILASPHLELMRPEELTNLKDAIQQTTGISREPAGPFNFADKGIVVHDGEDGDSRVAAVNGEIQWHPRNESAWMILASPHLEYMRPEDLTNLMDAIQQTTGISRGNFAVRDVPDWIRDCFVNHLSMWYSSYKREAATILELGLWKIELGRAREAGQGGERGRGWTRTDASTRDECRRTCGADPIVGLVLSALAGHHRRDDQLDEEPIQL